MFRAELEPVDVKLRRNQIHPIYELQRRIAIEEPYKRKGPTQCQNSQEYGHSQSYCKLATVCVVCGELHGMDKCNKPKIDAKVKKFSNCDSNHTATTEAVNSIVKSSKINVQKNH